jgi:hypothetical protein
VALLPPLVLPPRPPELPVSIPPPLPGQTPQTPGPHLRNDAFLSKWIDDLERVIKDNWIKLNALLQTFHDRITALERRIADTYTWGQKGPLAVSVPTDPEAPVEVSLLALPLRAVRDEEIVEIVVACEKAPELGATTLMVQVNEGNVRQVSLNVGVKLAEWVFPVPVKIKRNDALRVLIQAPGDAADVVVQARCR